MFSKDETVRRGARSRHLDQKSRLRSERAIGCRKWPHINPVPGDRVALLLTVAVDVLTRVSVLLFIVLLSGTRSNVERCFVGPAHSRLWMKRRVISPERRRRRFPPYCSATSPTFLLWVVFVCSASTPRALKASCMRTQGAPQNVAFSAPSALYQHTGFDTSKSETGVFSVIQDLTTTCLASAWKRFTVAAIRLPQPVPYCVHASCNNSLAWCGYVCDDCCRWWEWGTGAKGYLT